MMFIKKIKILFNEQALFKRARKTIQLENLFLLLRSNYYITGNGGLGKSVTESDGHYSNLPDEKEIFLLLEIGPEVFEITIQWAAVIIWDDQRAKFVIKNLTVEQYGNIAINQKKISLSS